MDKVKVVEFLDKVAADLEGTGRTDVALLLDKASDALEAKQASEEGTEKWAFDESVTQDDLLKDVDASMKEAVEKEIAGEVDFLKMAVDECYTADTEVEAAMRTIDAAKKRKKKWVQKIDLKKGRFTSYCKSNGFDGPCQACAEKALKSDDASVRGMASFWMATKKFKKKKSKK